MAKGAKPLLPFFDTVTSKLSPARAILSIGLSPKVLFAATKKDGRGDGAHTSWGEPYGMAKP